MNYRLIVVFALIALSSCVSKKKYKDQITKYTALQQDYEKVKLALDLCNSEKDKQNTTIEILEKEIEVLKSNSNALLNQLTDLSVISKTQAESIRKSVEQINSKDSYIKQLRNSLAKKDSLNMVLALNLKGALGNVNDQDVEIKVEGSAVFISISDKLLFKSGKYDITSAANIVLGKVATVLKAQPEVQFMVEGHTDNKPISTLFVKDNWDLSVLRATSVVRTLQMNFGIPPARMIACGRSEFAPLVPNTTDVNRTLNRRTRIIIIPQLDQFFKLLEPKN